MSLISDWFKTSKVGKLILAPFGWTGFTSKDGELVPAYFTAVKIMSENISKLSPYAADKNNKPIDNHKVTSILSNRPNKYQNKQKFWMQMETNRCNYGNAYAWIKRDLSGFPVELHIINPEAVKEASMDNDGVLWYKIDFSFCPMIVDFRDTKYVRYEDILHVTFGSKDDIFGVRPLDILSGFLNILGKAEKMIDSFYENNATSAMAIETTIDRAAAALKMSEMTEDFMEKYSGTTNAGKPIILPPNTKLVPINQKFADAQLIETQKFAREEIANLFGIPKFMFESTGSNDSIEQQTRQFLAFTISSVLEMYASEFEFKLLTVRQIDMGQKIIYDTEKLIETDAKTKMEVIATQVAKGLMTPNEGAMLMGNMPIESAYGDLHWVQSQNQPIEYYNQWGGNSSGIINQNNNNVSKGEKGIEQPPENNKE